MRKFINITENFVEATRPQNRFAKNPKLTIVIPNSVYEALLEHLTENGINIRIEDLKKNRAVLTFIENDIHSMYWDQFSEGLENLDLASELGYERTEDDEDEGGDWGGPYPV